MSINGGEGTEMLRRAAILGMASMALMGGATLLAPVTAASAKSHKATTHKKSKPKKKASSGAVVTTCPTAAQISAAAGSTYPAPKTSSASGTVACNYSDPSTSATLVLVFSRLAGTSASTLKAVADGQAHAQGVTAKSISGLGNAAYIFTLKDASANPSGVATTLLMILDGSTLVDITVEAPVAKVEAVGHYLLSR
jgi:hypothetical protein